MTKSIERRIKIENIETEINLRNIRKIFKEKHFNRIEDEDNFTKLSYEYCSSNGDMFLYFVEREKKLETFCYSKRFNTSDYLYGLETFKEIKKLIIKEKNEK
jgi:hypothetical protein